MFLLLEYFIILIMINNSLNQGDERKIKAAIFDLDGTLLDTQRLYDEVNEIVIKQYGNGKLYDADFRLKIHGAPPSLGNQYIMEYFQIRLTKEEFMGKKSEYLKDKINKCKPMKGAKEITNILKHKYGFKMAIATSSPKNSVDIKLSQQKEWIKSDFDIMITGEDKRIIKGKPSPDIFLLAAKELGVKPEECIIFEDAVNGVQAGLNSGAAIVVGVPDSHVKKLMENLSYDKTKSKLILLDSLKDFDYSLIQ